MCLLVISDKNGIKLGMPELKKIYNIKKNGVDEGKVYMSTSSGCRLVLKIQSPFQD